MYDLTCVDPDVVLQEHVYVLYRVHETCMYMYMSIGETCTNVMKDYETRRHSSLPIP